MAVYLYKARDASGKAVKGTMEAAGREELIDKLNKMGYMITQVNEAISGIKLESTLEKLKRVSTEDMIIFNIQLANMISAGISILSSLNSLSKQIENKKLRETIGDVARNIEAGDSFSQSLARYPKIFPFLLVSMMKVGEASGKLDRVLVRYAKFAEQQYDLKQKIKGALFYPMILLAAGVAVTLFVVTFIIPQFAEIFLKVGIKLPLVTQVLYKIGTGIKQYWYLGALLVGILALAIKLYLKTERGRLNFDRFKLKMPVFGSLHRKVVVSGFSRTLGTLLASGVHILEALDIVKGVVGNKVMANVIANVRVSVEKGESISESLRVSEEFPPDAIQMISAGEETGDLAGMLDRIADFYDTYIGYAVKKLTTIIEPLFLIIIGAMVGFIMASLLLPMFDMMKVLRH